MTTDHSQQAALRASLRSRVRQFREHQDASAVLDPQASAEAEQLWRAFQPATPEVELAVAELYWCQSLVLPAAEREPAYENALALYTGIFSRDPELVPEELRAQAAAAVRIRRESQQCIDAGLQLLERGRLGDGAALTQAVSLFARAVAALPDNNANSAYAMALLAQAVMIRFQRQGDRSDLEGAERSGMAAFYQLSAEHPLKKEVLRLVGATLLDYFEFTGSAEHLNGAVEMLQAAAQGERPGTESFQGIMGTLGSALHARFAATGRIEDLEAAAQVMLRACADTTASDDDRAAAFNIYGGILRSRYRRGGKAADLEQAVSASKEAVDLASVRHPARNGFLGNLAAALRARFERTGDPDDLSEAITRLREARSLAPMPNRSIDTQLASALGERYALGSDPADLTEAIAVTREAVESTPDKHPDYSANLARLSQLLRNRFLAAGQDRDLSEAVALGRRGVAATVLDPVRRADDLQNLAALLSTVYEHNRDLRALDEALTLNRRALELLPSEHPAMIVLSQSMAELLRAKHHETGDVSVLEEAVTFARQAQTLSRLHHRDNPYALYCLGAALDEMVTDHNRRVAMEEAFQAYRGAATMKSAETRVRITAGRAWGALAIRCKEPQQAVAGYAAAIEVLPVVSWRSLRFAERTRPLREYGGLAADAAAASIEAGLPGKAVELLEYGRAVIWSQVLETRGDLDELLQADPDLADQMLAIRAEIDGPADLPHDRAQHCSDRNPASADVAGALAEAWQAFTEAARDDPRDWDLASAAAEVRPEEP
jgi:tetratricopeptide (TPR) repeat protein